MEWVKVYKSRIMKKLSIYISLLFVLTCAKEDSQAPNTPPTQIVKQYALTASAGDGGSVTGGGTFASGTQVSLTATPNSGYSFSGWSNGLTTNPITVTLNSNTSLTANFQVIVNSYSLTVSAGEGGSVSSEGGEYEEGTEVTITAIPNEGYEFTEWSDGSTDIERTITLTTNLTLESLYTPLGNPFISIIQPNYLNPSHLTRIPYLHRNYIEMYNTYGTGLVKDNYVGPPRDAVVIDYNGDGYYDLVHSGTDWENSFRAAITDDDPLGNQHRNKIQFFYGNQKNVTEETLTQPTSYYGVSKLAGEYYTKLLWEFDKIPYTIFRLFATYGYGQDLNVMNQGIVSIYLKLALMSNTLDITLGKDSKRQLIHIDDVTTAFTYAPDVITDNKTYNLTYDETITPEKIINQLSKSLGRELMINEIEGYEGDQTMITGTAREFWVDTGWSPKVNLETGVNTFVKEVQRETKN